MRPLVAYDQLDVFRTWCRTSARFDQPWTRREYICTSGNFRIDCGSAGSRSDLHECPVRREVHRRPQEPRRSIPPTSRRVFRPTAQSYATRCGTTVSVYEIQGDSDTAADRQSGDHRDDGLHRRSKNLLGWAGQGPGDV